MNYSDIQHRFANRLEGKNGCVNAGNVRYEGRNYYSYSTVFGQWVDIEKNVCVIFDGSTSTSSSKHKLWKGVFPDDVHVFPLDLGGGYYGWRNCNLVSSYNFKDEDFKEYHRMKMIDHYVERIYNRLAAINGGKSKGLENVDFSAWGYIEELCSLYKDTSIAKYLKWSTPKNDMNKTQKELINRQRKLARMLKDGERNVETLTDALFGEGTYKTYWDYCARYRKSADKREKMEKLCNRLGIKSPYENWGGYGVLNHEMSADDIRNLTAKERVELHFKAIAFKKNEEQVTERDEKYNKNFRNAYKWIVGFEPRKKSWGGYEDEVENNCVNKDTGKVYECGGTHDMFDSFDWFSTIVRFDYDDFRKSEDKDKWIAEFYKKCEYAAMLRRAYDIFNRVNAHFEKRSFREKKFLDDDYLRENVSESEYEVCKKYIAAQDKHYADEEAQRRAREIERLRREEEERKEREYMEQVKNEQINECIEDGSEGCRNLWRKHLTSLSESENRYREVAFESDGDFFYNGNVLLRLNLNKDKVETSKSIRIPVDVCKKMWKIVSKWHENPASFKEMQIDTKGSGRYTISSYKNDILTAGCHKIAYTEMERMYNEIINA